MLSQAAASARRVLFQLSLIGFFAVGIAAPLNTPATAQPPADPLAHLIPLPTEVERSDGQFTVDAETRIILDQMALEPVGRYLADRLAPAFGTSLDITMLPPEPSNVIILSVIGDESLGAEGYRLTVTPDAVTVEANAPAGAFYGIQTLLQLLPPALDGGPASIPAATITDRPRFAHRGAMLDVARHFFGVADVKRVIDLMAVYKLNRLHLHLSDDQGWRIEIHSWPDLTTIGGSTAVGGGEGGFYTQADYAEIVAYAAAHFIEVVPELDMPGHTNAALASYPALNCDGEAPALYTGTEVGFSTLCADKEITYQFVDDVIRELAAMTPGPYIHIGGDESKVTAADDYETFVVRAQEIVQSYGKQAIGWEEIAQTPLLPGTVVQHWFSDLAARAVEQGAQVILSPASRIYLDMKYNERTPLGLTWAGLNSTEDAYSWRPAELLDGVPEASILGVEGPLWSETLETVDDIEYMLFPRLPGLAELGWSADGGGDWEGYRARLAAHGPRFEALGINFFRDPAIWDDAAPST